jgi:hypothetical protein
MRKLLAILAACLFFAGLLTSTAKAAGLTESEVKAAFIYNFIQFTTWPAGQLESARTLNVCLRPGSAVGLPLASMAGKVVHDVPLVIMSLSEQSLALCHAIFVEEADIPLLKRLSAKEAQMPILTLADLPDEKVAEPMISLSLLGKKIVFDVNASLARRAGLVISSRVLKLARSVK